MNTDNAAIRDKNRSIVEKAFGMISSGSYAQMGSLISEDLYFELPYGPGRKALEVRGRSAFLP